MIINIKKHISAAAILALSTSVYAATTPPLSLQTCTLKLTSAWQSSTYVYVATITSASGAKLATIDTSTGNYEATYNCSAMPSFQIHVVEYLADAKKASGFGENLNCTNEDNSPTHGLCQTTWTYWSVCINGKTPPTQFSLSGAQGSPNDGIYNIKTASAAPSCPTSGVPTL